jgi:hypothetical protein
MLFAAIESSIQYRASKNRRTADFLDSSRPTVKADGYHVSFDNDRNLARAIGVFQHGVQVFGLFDHIIIINLAAFFGKSFTSCPGIRSSILSEKQNFGGHFFLLFWDSVIVKNTPVFQGVALRPLIPQFRFSENNYAKRYKLRCYHWSFNYQ